jgi:hypothetical protein
MVHVGLYDGRRGVEFEKRGQHISMHTLDANSSSRKHVCDCGG